MNLPVFRGITEQMQQKNDQKRKFCAQKPRLEHKGAGLAGFRGLAEALEGREMGRRTVERRKIFDNFDLPIWPTKEKILQLAAGELRTGRQMFLRG
jgi:hypothetical protein